MKKLVNAPALPWRGPLLALAVVAAFVAAPGHPAAAATSDLSALSAGSSHTCALTTGGSLKCWGGNTDGQLGDGTITDRSTPVDVSGLTSGIAAVSAGAGHTCALTTGGGLKCWGDNSKGQLGDGTATDRSTPVDVGGLGSGVAAISAGAGHTCALTTGGGLKCWGDNSKGQLGDGTTTDRSTPVDVSGLTSGTATVSAGAGHTCALTTGDGLKCWGNNSDGQLGDGTGGPDTSSAAPVDVTGLASGVAAVSAGGLHTCALTTGGGLKCWGDNSNGQLGDGTNEVWRNIRDLPDYNATPVDVVGGLATRGVATVSAGISHTCAVTAAGVLKCWGSDGTETRAGRSGSEGYCTDCPDRTVPLNVAGLISDVVAVSSGELHTCALTMETGVKCWGDNSKGQLGDGTTTGGPTPVAVIFGPPDPSASSVTGAGDEDIAPVVDTAEDAGIAAIAGAAAVVLIILIAGGWYARRRWLQKRS